MLYDESPHLTENDMTENKGTSENPSIQLSPKNLRKNLNNSFEKLHMDLKIVESKSQLLWWKESLYSSSKRMSYRKIKPTQLVVFTMAFDLVDLVSISRTLPEGTEHFLEETIAKVLGTSNKESKLENHLKAFLKVSQELPNDFAKATHFGLTDGCYSLLDFIDLLIQGKSGIDSFEDKTGISPNSNLKPSELGVILFRDLIVNGLLNYHRNGR